ncbi:MAG: DUF3703 domain-containing protein [Pseudomonadota bacterium]
MRASHEGFRSEIRAAREALERGDRDAAFARLERAHILGQISFIDHVVVHLCMLKVARLRRDAREIRGQLLRLIATIPGHLFGWVPIGNTRWGERLGASAHADSGRPAALFPGLQPRPENLALVGGGGRGGRGRLALVESLVRRGSTPFRVVRVRRRRPFPCATSRTIAALWLRA